MKQFKNWYNTENFPDPGERNIHPSLTQPDQAMSVQEMIDRHRRGLPVRGYADMQYVDENDPLEGRDLRSLDLEEVKQLRDKMVSNYNKARDKWLKEETDRRRQEQEKAAVDKFKKDNPHLFKEQSPAQPE